jgi:hypothetical protein
MEKRPRDLSFGAGTFSRFALKHRITMVGVKPVDPLGVVAADEIQRSRDFEFTLLKDDQVLSGSITLDRYLEYLADIDDVLENLANDAAVYEHFHNNQAAYGRLVKSLGVDVSQLDLPALFDRLGDQASKLRAFLGEDTYREFLKATEVRGPWADPGRLPPPPGGFAPG